MVMLNSFRLGAAIATAFIFTMWASSVVHAASSSPDESLRQFGQRMTSLDGWPSPNGKHSQLDLVAMVESSKYRKNAETNRPQLTVDQDETIKVFIYLPAALTYVPAYEVTDQMQWRDDW